MRAGFGRNIGQEALQQERAVYVDGFILAVDAVSYTHLIVDLIEQYNAQMQAAGHEEGVIRYTDYVGSLMSSVTTIVDTISYVLIAFVSISLVVSSIMIGIITYISVLERTKETVSYTHLLSMPQNTQISFRKQHKNNARCY